MLPTLQMPKWEGAERNGLIDTIADGTEPSASVRDCARLLGVRYSRYGHVAKNAA